ncbi:hypothetical protein JNK13_00005, partial [bacterium]|nr:hypothetical protein [bacterium]
PRGIEVRNANDTIDSTATNLLGACTGSVSQIGNYAVNSITNYANAFYNNREDKYIKMLEVDMRSLLDCLHNSNWLTQGKALNDDTEGGIVFFFTVKGPDASNTANKYGVRIWNAQNLQATVGGAPLVKGMSIVSDQAVYLRGHYNSTNKIPAAVMADSINILSGNLNDDATDESNLTNRTATDTTVNAAFLSGTDSTGNTEGTGGWNGAYNGGVENFPRFHENWSNRTFTYKGSIVSLNKARHVNGAWQINGRFYNAPTRVWSFDTDFNDAAKLPPLSPRFVYLKQELFVRDFEQ